MNKNIIIKSIAALTILTSVTGVGTTMVEGIQQTAKAEHNVKLIKNTNVAPYNGIVSIGSGTGFIVGKIQLLLTSMSLQVWKLAHILLRILMVNIIMAVL